MGCLLVMVIGEMFNLLTQGVAAKIRLRRPDKGVAYNRNEAWCRLDFQL